MINFILLVLGFVILSWIREWRASRKRKASLVMNRMLGKDEEDEEETLAQMLKTVAETTLKNEIRIRELELMIHEIKKVLGK